MQVKNTDPPVQLTGRHITVTEAMEDYIRRRSTTLHLDYPRIQEIHAGCHRVDGKGGVPNPNSKTAQLVPDLIHVAEGYTKEELKDRILKGQREITPLDPKLPPPALHAWLGWDHRGCRSGRSSCVSHQFEAGRRRVRILGCWGASRRGRKGPNERQGENVD